VLKSCGGIVNTELAVRWPLERGLRVPRGGPAGLGPLVCSIPDTCFVPKVVPAHEMLSSALRSLESCETLLII
jgi:hypothetical protein